MKSTRRYETAHAFDQALNDKIREFASAETLYDIPRLRRQIAFERFLCRVFSKQPSPWVLKGGVAMELRIDRARATQDLDLGFKELSLRDQSRKERESFIYETLVKIARIDLGDFFEYLIPAPKYELTGTPFGGTRFSVETRLADKTFAKFRLDIAVGETMLPPLEHLPAKNWLSFAGFPGVEFPTITKEQQFAEKLHAYTRPRRSGQSSRSRDLVDLVLLISSEKMNADKVGKAIGLVFQEHPTHSIPTSFPDPPANWGKPYSEWASFCGIERDLGKAVNIVRKFVETLQLK